MLAAANYLIDKGDDNHMTESPDILKLRVLLCFLKSAPEHCTVTGISRTLNEKKYTISRSLQGLAKDGLIDRTDARHPLLTEKGSELARRYAERVEIATNHLLYEGVDIENAKQDASYWALYCSDKLMEVVHSSEERYRVKLELRNQKTFSGTTLCKRLKDGCYQFPFIIYRECVKGNSNISMANEGFEHPCTLYVNGGEGLIQLRSLPISARSGLNGKMIHGKVNKMEYFDAGQFVNAELHGTVVSFPADALNFVNMGTGVGQVLHGTVCLKMQCSCGLIHMPESKAIFTIII